MVQRHVFIVDLGFLSITHASPFNLMRHDRSPAFWINSQQTTDTQQQQPGVPYKKQPASCFFLDCRASICSGRCWYVKERKGH